MDIGEGGLPPRLPLALLVLLRVRVFAYGLVGSDRYHQALGYLRGESALVGDEHTATGAGDGQHHGYAAYFFTWQGVRLLEG